MSVRILTGDCRDVLSSLPDRSVQCCVTSPPYFGLRDYGCDGQIGLEQTPDAYVAEMVAVFREVRRVLRDDGVAFINLGDSYASKPASANGYVDGRANRESRTSSDVPAGYKPKDILGIPWLVAFALRADGWYLRQDIIWAKPNPMPESVRDRCTKAHEYVFLLSKNARYYFDSDAIAENTTTRPQQWNTTTHAYCDADQTGLGAHKGLMAARAKSLGGTRNKRSVWTIATQPFSGAHFATMPPELAETCIKAGSKPGDVILDPFGGAGTTALVADRLLRNALIIELNPEYAKLARDRINEEAGLFAPVAAE